jgi:hypothetical protein
MYLVVECSTKSASKSSIGRLQRWRQEGVVDQRKRAGLVRGIDHEAQVGDAQQRVGRRLDPDQRRRFLPGLGQRARIGQVAW